MPFNSSDVSAGQHGYASDYNDLRQDVINTAGSVKHVGYYADIETAFADLGSGDTLFLDAAASYTITDTLTITANGVTIVGYGSPHGQGYGTRILSNFSISKTAILSIEANYVTIRNVGIGMVASSTIPTHSVLVKRGFSFNIIEGCGIYTDGSATGGNGVTIGGTGTGTAYYNKVLNCNFDRQYQAVVVEYAQRNLVANNVMVNVTSRDINMTANSSYNMAIGNVHNLAILNDGSNNNVTYNLQY